jgi:CubicO group peptidase (beta-lactamase class C family)
MSLHKRPCFVIALALLTCSAWCGAEELPVTGRSEASLAAFDQLMLTFVREHDVPGASLAIARHGRIVYARGFGYADIDKHEPVQPDSLFRIASVSKPFTAVAILQLQERGKLRLDDHPFELLRLEPHLENGATPDPRLKQITIRELLHHTGGFDRGISFDPMFRPIMIANAMGVPPPASPKAIIQYMMGRPLDFNPGTREAYSNFGYCVLGRVVEKASGKAYADYVQEEVLAPLGIHRMRQGRSLESQRAKGEVKYYPRNDSQVKSIFGDGQMVPDVYGGWCIESMDSHGAWIASASELVQFASSFEDPDHCPILKPGTIKEMFARPGDTGYDTQGKPKPAYYACGWEVRPVRKGKANTWHTGLLNGTATLLVHRYDDIAWAILFNRDRDPDQKYLADLIDPLLHPIANAITDWPEGDLLKDTN